MWEMSKMTIPELRLPVVCCSATPDESSSSIDMDEISRISQIRSDPEPDGSKIPDKGTVSFLIPPTNSSTKRRHSWICRLKSQTHTHTHAHTHYI
ncbi:hypothetical protein Phum_PHUM047040 [Pediculus humanus corporis]|uniref:Uncharacterized protein n=1 Tax=Pediculus humanus subsp. corporis TaxID=121224 RepID=E0VAY8_PEDHC|nr:uncharacterized protein Phum_PHUM047040 [Pediculus humanus corporis]EEB10544.1 hypothetical protein Phum_PHUM047040 [Pediculus humanus corporis]